MQTPEVILPFLFIQLTTPLRNARSAKNSAINNREEVTSKGISITCGFVLFEYAEVGRHIMYLNIEGHLNTIKTSIMYQDPRSEIQAFAGWCYLEHENISDCSHLF